MQRASELLISQADSITESTWWMFDEVREMGKLTGLPPFLTNGRSKGGRAILGFQDIEGLRSVYGDKLANEMLGMCSNKAFFRVESAETAKWASQLLGDRIRRTRGRNVVDLSNPTTNQLHEQRVNEPAKLPSEFLMMPYPNRTSGLSGVYLSANIGAWEAWQSGQEIEDSLPVRSPRVQDFVPRPIEHQFLLPWTDDDLRRLKLTRETD